MRKGDRTRLRILEAAALVLSQSGYHRTSMEDVAKQAGMRGPSLFYHFKTKDDLVEAVLAAGIADATESIVRAMSARPRGKGVDKLGAAIRGYLRSVLQEADVLRTNIRCFDEVPPELRRRLAGQMRDFIRVWEDIVETGRADGSLRAELDPPLFCRMLIAALNSTARKHHEFEVELLTDQAIMIFLDGASVDTPRGRRPEASKVAG